MIKLGRTCLERFHKYMEEKELSRATILKYEHDIRLLSESCGGTVREKADLLRFKEELTEKGYAPASVNSMLAAVNSFLSFQGKIRWKLKYLKIQREAFYNEELALSSEEYKRMVGAAKERDESAPALILQTIAALGLRVSELSSVTAETVKDGRVLINSKGKTRTLMLPEALLKRLRRYCKEKKITAGPVFGGKTRKGIHRTNVWRLLKGIAKDAGVSGKKAFPHNLRHFFAQQYYGRYRDLVHLAALLGHSSVNTTKIYALRSWSEQKIRIEELGLVI